MTGLSGFATESFIYYLDSLCSFAFNLLMFVSTAI